MSEAEQERQVILSKLATMRAQARQDLKQAERRRDTVNQIAYAWRVKNLTEVIGVIEGRSNG